MLFIDILCYIKITTYLLRKSGCCKAQQYSKEERSRSKIITISYQRTTKL